MIRSNLILFAELVALFVGIAFAVHLVQRRLGDDRIRTWMSGPPPIAALKGIAIGFVTPFCTFSAIPMLVALRRAGVPAAGYVAFIVAAPVLDPVLFGALAVIGGIRLAVVYLAVAFTGALGLALLAQRVGVDRWVDVDGVGAAAATSSPHDEPWRGSITESRAAWRSAAGLLRRLGPILVVGIAIGMAIESAVDPSDVESMIGDHTAAAIPIAALLGTPLYFSTELFVPIADSLDSAGVGIGAIVALTIAGAGANIPEFVILSRVTTARVLAVFCTYVFVVAAAGGAIAQALA